MHKSDQSIVVRHREFITTVNSSIGYTVQQSFDINPGNRTLFPWLSGIAARFQEYRIRGMVFHYVPTSGSAVASSNAALGAVMLQTTYRASDTAPASKIEMLNEYNSNESVPSEAFCHPIECDPKENPFNIQYVRTANTTALEDKLLYDLGTTHLAVQGCQTNGNALGDLWVTFEVELKKPIVSSSITSTLQSYIGNSATSSVASLFPTPVAYSNTLPVTLAGSTISFPRGISGTFQVTVRMTGAFTSLTSWASPTVAGGVTLLTVLGLPQVVYTQLTAGAGVMDGPCQIFYLNVDTTQATGSTAIATPAVVGTVNGAYISILPFI